MIGVGDGAEQIHLRPSRGSEETARISSRAPPPLDSFRAELFTARIATRARRASLPPKPEDGRLPSYQVIWAAVGSGRAWALFTHPM